MVESSSHTVNIGPLINLFSQRRVWLRLIIFPRPDLLRRCIVLCITVYKTIPAQTERNIKVDQADIPAVCQHNISWFQIAVNDRRFLIMQITQGSGHLFHPNDLRLLRESSSGIQILFKRISGNKFHNRINIPVILYKVHNLRQICMFEILQHICLCPVVCNVYGVCFYLL